LIVKFENSTNEDVQKILKPLKTSLKNKTSIKETTELTLELRLKGDNTAFMTQLTALEGVKSAVLVEYTGDFGE
jgi:translation initiation factor 1 (eIF-1/SUI1)